MSASWEQKTPIRLLLEQIVSQNATIIRQNAMILAHQEKTMSVLDNLKAEVANNTSVEKSAAALLGNLKKELDDAIANGDMGAVQEISDTLAANDADLSAAITANTPAQTPPAQ